jgi:23S rRNA-/tRNA-specific pseudouridylate synthase
MKSTDSANLEIVLYTGWLVVNKPAGLAVHSTAPDQENLLDEVIHYIEQNQSAQGTLDWQKEDKLHLINRLDKETSGLVIIATKLSISQKLYAMTKEGNIKKSYIALLHPPTNELTENELTWNWELENIACGINNIQGGKDRKIATTICSIVEQFEDCILVDINLITGRTHQIRRHAALAKMPVIGDQRYTRIKSDFSHLALHAYSLELIDPSTEEPCIIETDMPERFKSWLQIEANEEDLI